MSNYTTKTTNNYYDLFYLKSIPIDDVCHQLGLEVQHKGSRLWVKLRNEKEPSAIININNNTIYDFGDPYIFGTTATGGPKQGDPLDLIQYIYSCDFIEATERLANMFNVNPLNQKKNRNNFELTNQDYLKIGIYGDKVSKNLNFDPKLSSEELFEIADKFSFSVNELRKSKKEEHLKIYENVILRDKALPFIQQMRNSYFVCIWEQYSFLKDINALELFDTVCMQKEIADMHKSIITAEKIFNRAVEGTRVKKINERDYSPDKILTDILDNRLKPELGTLNYKKINKLAKLEKCTVKYDSLDPVIYYELKEQLDNIPHRAFYNEEQIILGYLSINSTQINSILGRDPGKTTTIPLLDSMVTDAENRKKGLSSNNLQKTKKEQGDNIL